MELFGILVFRAKLKTRDLKEEMEEKKGTSLVMDVPFLLFLKNAIRDGEEHLY